MPIRCFVAIICGMLKDQCGHDEETVCCNIKVHSKDEKYNNLQFLLPNLNATHTFAICKERVLKSPEKGQFLLYPNSLLSPLPL
jgi:hypothetical protein